MEYYVYITNDCNMNCAYCSVLFDTKKYRVPLTPQYSFADLEKFVSKTQQLFNDSIADIYFFGGEPTVDFNCINKLIKAFDQPHNYRINYIMHTNGLLIPETPQNILKKVNLVILSYNYELIYKNGQVSSYFGKMTNSINHIKSINNIPIIGRITVSSKTSLYTECCLISGFVDYVYWQIDNCEYVGNFEAYKSQYKYDISLLFNYWFNYFKNGTFLRFVPFISAIRNIIAEPERPTHFYCGYGTSMIYIQTNGKCYACCDNVAANSHYIGDIFEGIEFSNNQLENTICNNCEYIKICGGRCGRMHKDFSIDRIKQYCDLNQFMFDLIKSNVVEITEIITKYPEYINMIMDPMLSYTEYTA